MSKLWWIEDGPFILTKSGWKRPEDVQTRDIRYFETPGKARVIKRNVDGDEPVVVGSELPYFDSVTRL